MKYIYKHTVEIEALLRRIDVAQQVLASIPKKPLIELRLQRESLLKSALYSARIEGNSLKLTDVGKLDKHDTRALEVQNLQRAYSWLRNAKQNKKLVPSIILNLHRIAMNKLSAAAGKFRHEQSAIFNSAGIAVYMPPPPSEIKSLVDQLISFYSSTDYPAPIHAAIIHYEFEKIHPFLDGNGRVGRLLSVYILHTNDYDFRGLVTIEQYLEENRQLYYDLLALPSNSIMEFVEFFLTAIAQQAEQGIKTYTDAKDSVPEDNLLPRRREILEIIRDHKIVSFDNIKRRFARVPESTLHYDLRQLYKSGFVNKLGSTRGSLYTINTPSV
ncbi:hypothetical protein COW99_00275 [Candidatus Roizmanbacteria bacterium CG22_combo_CG10-13_8_21_14_all_38_20]|uniref:Fido domain-containing protein n=1 Tax=Candidatus Roizmanbacteria bacterium CG22_combo_CG10-13_8_21_14_all_38_20 TaxID=1974862 RepID=A0A2H0BWP7_9BACT|nr:Fic family protein [Candidatus Microgenomates bacterium]PIP62107.1 MAG: hypothetical protein COW99_00275 [Candidatus Roizmanbacteria bacterium CG22_combo_CG10-13_8_21_14_all_38_20]PJC31833.1 MAG: hypothetical protein CO050_01960 [Candidatus Roizmanbacteria bacterium CG_4_9_14_0_2_um_filter_38_17]